MSPLISVILPVYNVEKYLKKCIQSIINQTYQNLEIVCIDDGSTDKSGEILDEAARNEPRIKVIHQENRGLMSVRTMGIQEAKGEYISFVDGDDYITTNMLQTLLSAIETNGSDMSVCGFELTDENDNVLNTVVPQTKTIDGLEAMKELLYKDVYKTGLSPLWNKLYKKELFNDFKPSDKIKNLGEDIYINLSLINKAKKLVLAAPYATAIFKEATLLQERQSYHILMIFWSLERKKYFIDKLGLLNSNKKEVFKAYFSSVFDFYGFCYTTDKTNLIPHFNKMLKTDTYFNISNVPLSLKIIARGAKFLTRRYL